MEENVKKVKIRLMELNDYDAIVQIDEKVNKIARPEYYKLKFEKLVESKDYVPTSLVAVDENGKVVGFIMGELFRGEYGISEDRATLDTIGVDPDFQNFGIGRQLIEEFLEHLKTLGVEKVNTLVKWNDSQLITFFSVNGFVPSKMINLVRNI
jgi:predicted N-acetyltransferase YhbS